MKTTRHHIYTPGLALALAASSLHATTSKLPAPKPEFLNSEQLAEWRAKKTAEFESKKAEETQMRSVEADAFYTGKPYLEETGTYCFNSRNYDATLNRWTTPDPTGFPDGVNNQIYVNNSVLVNLDRRGENIYTITVGGGTFGAGHAGMISGSGSSFVYQS